MARFAWTRFGGRLVAVMMLGLLASSLGFGAEFLDRRLADVLDELNAGGESILYSTGLVSPSLRVLEEPTRTHDLAMLLEELLAPHDLGVSVEGESFVVVRRPRGGLEGRVELTPDRRPLAGAEVWLSPGGYRVRTSGDGVFLFSRIPAGAYELRASFPPMQSVVVSVTILAGQTGDATIEIPIEPLAVKEITVTPSKVTLSASDAASTVQGRDEIELVPTIGGEVINAVTRIPGIATDDTSAALRVRGSSERDSMIVVDGLELYEPFHLTAFQSPFSLIDARTVGRLEFTSGSTTAEFGDRQGGILEIDPVSGLERDGAELTIGTSNSGFLAGGGLGDGSWLASGRLWYPDAWIDTITRDEQGIEPDLVDLYGQISVPLARRHRMTINALSSFDSVDFVSEDGEDRTDDSSWRAYGWVRVTSAWSENVVSKTLVSMGALDDNRSSSIAEDDEDPRLEWNDDRRVRFVGVKQDWEIDLGEAVLARFGADLRSTSASYRLVETEFPSTGPEVEETRLDPAGHATAIYASPRVRLASKVAMELGLRWDRQSYTSEDQISPRLHFMLNATPRTAVRFGWGHYFQSQRIYELSLADGEDAFSPAQRSEDFVVSAAHRLPSGVRLRADFYTKHLDRLQPRFENEFNRIALFPGREEDRIRIDAESARLAGVELLARSEEGRRWGWWISYAYSRAQERVAGANVRRSWDQPHAAKFSVSYRTVSNWSASLAGAFHTGWPTTPVEAQVVPGPGGASTVELVAGARNSDRLPNYLRFDAKVRREVPLRRGTLQIDVDVLNLLDRDNVCCIGDVEGALLPGGGARVTREEISYGGFTPTVSLTWRM